jgi:hypothetical protein
MNRFGTFARNRQNGFVVLTICFVVPEGDDTFPGPRVGRAVRISAGRSDVSCPLAALARARFAAAVAAPAGLEVPAAAMPARRLA